MHSRLDFDAHPLPLDVQPSLLLSSRRARLAHAIQKRDGQKSSRAQGEVRDVRVHRRGRCSKLQLVSVAPRYDGSVTAAAFDVGRHGRSTRPHRPSRLLLSDFRVIFYIHTELGSGRAARAAHGFHMNLFRVAPRASGRKCATTAESWRGAPNFFCGHVPRYPRCTPECNGALRRARLGSGESKRVRRARYMANHRGRREGVNNSLLF